MLLKQLKIRNICQHRRVDLELAPGVIGVVGPNGSGKTNLVCAIRATLTNDFGFSGRTRAQQIRRGITDSAKSWVSAIWEHNGQSLEIVRKLSPSGNRLVFGKRQLTRAKEIQDELYRIFNISPQVLNEYVFVGQDETLKFLSDKAATRKENFAYLCGAEFIEKLWQTLGDQLAAETATPIELVDLQGIRAQLSAALSEIKCHKQTIRKADKAILPTEQLRELNQRIHACTQLSELEQQLLQQRQQYKQTAEELTAKTAEYNQLVATLAESETQQARLDKAAADAEAVLQEQPQLEANAKRRAEILQILAQVPQAPPTPPDDARTAAVLLSKLAQLQAELDYAQQTVHLLETQGTEICPVCKSTTGDLATYKDSLRQQLDTLPKQIKTVGARLTQRQRYEDRVKLWQARQETAQANNERLQRELELIPEKEPVQNKEQLRQAITQAKAATARLNKLRLQLVQVRQEQQRLTERKEQRRIAGTELKQQVLSLQADCDELPAMQAAVEQHELALRQRAEAEGELRQCRYQKERLQKQLESAKQTNRVQLRLQKWREDLASWREVVHRDNLPRIYMQAVLEEIVDDVNANLAEFGSPFTVSANEDISFTVHNDDGTTEPANSKSKGEKVVLALAYRLAINSRFASDVGIMVLDEPTDGLDESNMGCLVSILDRICEVTRKRGQQIILITHDKRLERVFDQVIRLG